MNIASTRPRIDHKRRIFDMSSTPPRFASGSASINRPVPRLEDERLLRGGSRYVSDLIATSKALRVAVLRSPHAHARIVAVDASKARPWSGGIAVLPAVDFTKHGHPPGARASPGLDAGPAQPRRARGRVPYVGEPIAAVAAETAHAAEDALAAITVTYQKLPGVADQEAALEDGAPRLHDAVPGNIAFRFPRAGGNVARAFAEAGVVIRR